MDGTDGNQIISIIALSIFFGAFVLAILVVFSRKTDKEDDKSKEPDEKSDKERKNEAKSKSTVYESKKVTTKQKMKAKDPAFTHPLLLASLKGHTGIVTQTEFSRCGKYLGSCSEGMI